MTQTHYDVGRPVLQVATMATAMTVAVLLQVVFGALGPFIVDDLGLSRTQLGALTTAMYVSAALLSTAGGRVVDRLGARPPLLGLFGVMAISVVIVAAAPTYLILVLGSLLAGLSIAIANPVTNRMIQTSIAAQRQGLVTGIKQSGIQVGVFIGSAALPVIAGLAGWRTATLVCLAPTAVGAMMTLRSVPASARQVSRQGSGSWANLPTGTGWLTAYAFAMGVGISSVSAYLPLFGVEDLGLAKTVAGLLSAVVGGVAMVARLGWGVIADRVPSALRWALTAMALLAISGAAMLIGAATLWFWLVWVGAAVIGISTAAWNGMAMLAVIRQAPAHVAGLASGVVVLGFYSGFAAGPIVFGGVVDATDSYALGWAMVTGAAVISVGLSLVWRQTVYATPTDYIRKTP
ncbi:MAG: MFS transporter [Euzebya sp.]